MRTVVNRSRPPAKIMNDMIRKFLDGQLSYGYDSVLCDTSYPCPNVATSATAGPASLIQTHLAPFPVAIPIYANPETGDLVFLFSLPIIDANIYRLKDVVNVGFWQAKVLPCLLALCFLCFRWRQLISPESRRSTTTFARSSVGPGPRPYHPTGHTTVPLIYSLALLRLRGVSTPCRVLKERPWTSISKSP